MGFMDYTYALILDYVVKSSKGIFIFYIKRANVGNNRLFKKITISE